MSGAKLYACPAIYFLCSKLFIMLRVCISYNPHDVCLKVGIHN